MPDSYHVAGDLLRTSGTDVAAALAEGPWAVRVKSPSEVMVNTAEASFSIYASRSGSGSYLVSGDIDGTVNSARTLLEAMGERLAARSIVYHFEMAPRGDPDEEHVIEHPKYANR